MKLYATVLMLILTATSLLGAGTRVFDFGPADSPTEPGAVSVAADTAYSSDRGYGWVGRSTLDIRDRGLGDKLQRDFVFGTDRATFRVDVPNGYYRVTVGTGDSLAGDHVLNVAADGQQVIPAVQPATGEIISCAFTALVTQGRLELTLSSPVSNWVVNSLEISPANGPGETATTKSVLPIPRPTVFAPIAHNDRLRLVKKPAYSLATYPSAADLMRILERFPMYSERGWHADFLDDPDLGYFGDADHGEMGLRSMGNYIFVTALLATDPAYDPRVTGISAKTLLARARACLAYMTRAHTTGDLHCADNYPWGDAWQSAWWTARMAAGARILWPHLTSKERADVQRVIIHEADRHLKRVPPSGETSDTKAEENAWDSEVLAWAVGMFPDHAHAPAWRQKLIEFCMNTLSCRSDKQDVTPIDGKPVQDWMVTANIHDDCTIENHGAYHFCYMACPIHSMAWGFEGLTGGAQDVPDSMFHHYEDVWQWAKRSYIGDGRFAYLCGKDWPRYAYGLSFILPATVLAELRYDDPDARLLEHDRIALLEREQLINCDGSFYGGRFTRNILGNRTAEYETDTYANIALCYLLHKHGKTPTPTRPDKFREQFAGSWSSPQSGWVFGRSPELFASFSWRYLGGSQPIGLFIPTGCGDMAEWMPGQLAGSFDAVGIDRRKGKCRHEQITSDAGFSTTGEIIFSDSAGVPTVSQQISFTALTDEGVVVVLDRIIALGPVTVKSSSSVNLALGNDIFNNSIRTIADQGSPIILTGARNLGTVEAAESGSNVPTVKSLPITSPWICVDDRLGIALLNGDDFAIRDYSGRNALWGSLQYDVVTAQNVGQRELGAGQSILESAFVLVCGDRATASRMHELATAKTMADQSAVRYAIISAPSGKRYLIVANLDGAARSVSTPGFPDLTFKFDGFGTEFREVDRKQ